MLFYWGNMDLISAIVSVVVALFSFAGGIIVTIVTQKHTDKRHDADIDVKKDENISKQITDVETKCNNEITSIRNETKASFDLMNKQLSELKEMFAEMHAGYQQTVSVISLQIDNLEKKQDLHNSVVTRMFLAEKDIEVLKQRESVSENRLADIERHEEQRQNKGE